MNTAALHRVPISSLRALAESLEHGLLSGGITRHGLQQIVGPFTLEVDGVLTLLSKAGMSLQQMALVVGAVADARLAVIERERPFDLVLSGPDVPGVPTSDTAATFHALIEQAEREVLLVGYAVYDGQRLFRPLAIRMQVRPELTVTFCLHIGRKPGDNTSDAEVVRRFVGDFRVRHWPWEPLPAIYYDPRSLRASAAERASLHAKCVVVDRRIALITSANFTEAAQHRNIEAGIILRHPETAQRLVSYVEGLKSQRVLVACDSGE